jgi:DNA-binding NarL/FixJ family response regulator
VVDDHTTFTELFTRALDMESDLVCVGSARSPHEALARFLELEPDVVVMDLHLAGGNGLDAAERILARSPHTRILLLTGAPTRAALERAAEMGICAFLPKDGSLATVLDALRRATRGSMVVVTPLTPRELKVLRLMADGNDVRTNARLLGITDSTCRGHVKAILAKLGTHSQLEAVAAASRLGLLAEPFSA